MIDFHSHLDLYPEPNSVVRECASRGMYVLAVTTTPSAWTGSSKLPIPESKIRTALGLHPQLAHQRMSELDLFDEIVHETKYVGEIGLDGAPEFKAHWDEQIKVFEHILKSCSNAGGRILSIHSRRSVATVLDTLKKFPEAGTSVLHWYSGNKTDLERAISFGCWFSVGPPMFLTEKSRELVNRMPRHRILPESDGPFVQIGGRSAMPWDVQGTYIGLQSLWGTTAEQTSSQLNENLRQLVTPKL